MATVGLRTMRIWMLILTFINLVIIISHYAEQKYWDNWRNFFVYNGTGTNNSIILKREKFLLWQDWVLIVSSSALFLAYIYAYKVITTRLHKYLRALLMVIPTVLMLFVGIQYVHLVLKLEFPRNHGPPSPFACNYLSGLERAYCGVVEATYFFAILTGLFGLLEIYVTIRNGPMQPKENHSYESNGGNGAGATVEFVGPCEQQTLSPQQFTSFAISDQPMLLSSSEQGKATLDTPEQQKPTTPAQPSPLLQQQLPPEQIYDTRAPLPNPSSHSVQAQAYETYTPGAQYQPPPRPPMPDQIYDNRTPIPNQHSVQAQAYETYTPGAQYQPPPRLPMPDQMYDNRIPLANPHSVQASAGPPISYLPARAQIEHEPAYYRMPLPNPTPEETAAGPPSVYPPARIQQEFDMRPPANATVVRTAPSPPTRIQQDEYDQRPPASTTVVQTAPYHPTLTKPQKQYGVVGNYERKVVVR
ncbi:hypothetical protein KI688_007975 [Linnemannia hyalina]|uniref:Uncharacterized protein n=1 Tax=Linnemannia hyalina TaxID=64524 RepID=A0A9P7Y2S4_9FUNG|nr:hypothetical protein KI688_007975 [Linnemannia hyalina]